MTQEQKAKQRITIRIQRPYLEALDRLLRQIHLRRDAYLNAVLPNEVELLEGLDPNSEKSAKYLRQMRGALSDKVRTAVTLDRKLVERMNKVCETRRIVRDSFIERFIAFLVLGDDEYGTCISPLVKAAELLENPRHEYVSNDHPYADLSITDKEVDEARRLPSILSQLFAGGNDEK